MTQKALVVGGGISGIQASLDLADQGIKVYLVEKTPSIGGRMAQLDKTFPTLDCSSCILTPKMVDISRHKNIDLMTYSEIQSISGSVGHFKVKVLKKPRYVNAELCTGCKLCLEKCPGSSDSEFDQNLGKRKAIYVPFPQAIPMVPVIDPDACRYILTGKCGLCDKRCAVGAIDFDQKEEVVELDVGSIIFATGLYPYSPVERNDYGYNDIPDVITSLEFERLISSTGPTEGHVHRLSDGKTPSKVAFIQCVGSRSELSNYYCSRFCCMVSIKEAVLMKDHYPDSECTIFHMDIRAFGKGFQEFYNRSISDYGVKYIKGKVGKIEQNNGSLLLKYEDVEKGKTLEDHFDLVVLAVGAVPSVVKFPIQLSLGDDTFVQVKDRYLDPVATSVDGIFIAGVGESPKDIPDSVVQAGAAAMRASIICTEVNQ
ncbi:MAG: CoB--CoM heterodisulfide reductase iron-sulfur subunit A family protein [Candidatus Heimdallarchaeota archaeon]|nr:CoB--CoM heterodisulfide reductase iron-sulfur subunit A family protein [Candidatus Heimdallarchaeota archaeon]